MFKGGYFNIWKKGFVGHKISEISVKDIDHIYMVGGSTNLLKLIKFICQNESR